jgi:hypothetical protein
VLNMQLSQNDTDGKAYRLSQNETDGKAYRLSQNETVFAEVFK